MENKSMKIWVNFGLVVLFGVIYFVFLNPAIKENENLENELMKLRGQVLNVQNEFDKLKLAESELSEQTEIAKMQALQAIPERLNQDELIRFLTQLIQENEVILNSISFGLSGQSVVANQSVKVATVNLSLTSNESQLIAFLKALETSARKFVVKNISVQYIEDSGIVRANYSLNLETYYQIGI